MQNHVVLEMIQYTNKGIQKYKNTKIQKYINVNDMKTHPKRPLWQVKYSKQDLNETKEERKQRKYRYLYQVTAF